MDRILDLAAAAKAQGDPNAFDRYIKVRLLGRGRCWRNATEQVWAPGCSNGGVSLCKPLPARPFVDALVNCATAQLCDLSRYSWPRRRSRSCLSSVLLQKVRKLPAGPCSYVRAPVCCTMFTPCVMDSTCYRAGSRGSRPSAHGLRPARRHAEAPGAGLREWGVIWVEWSRGRHGHAACGFQALCQRACGRARAVAAGG